MAIIGPRPLLVQYLERYNEEQHHRHDVRPGLTGYAQAHGRNAVSWEDKFAMDVWYTKHITFGEDVKIVWDTIMTVLKHEGISSETSATMEEFMGTMEGVTAKWKAPYNYYIEINPRYGGGAPLSMKSGAKSAEALLKILCGKSLFYQENCSCNGAIYSRFDQSVCISEGDNTQPVRGVIFDLDDTLYSEKQYIMH